MRTPNDMGVKTHTVDVRRSKRKSSYTSREKTIEQNLRTKENRKRTMILSVMKERKADHSIILTLTFRVGD